MSHIVIIGNGITGTTVAREVRKRSNDKITIVSAETEYFFSRTALMYLYMGHMTFENIKPYEDWFWPKNRINLVHDHVVRIDTKAKQLILQSGNVLNFDRLVLATGSLSNKFGWPGQDLEGVQGFYSYQDLKLLERNTKNLQHAVIVGGGLIGVELSEMLLSRQVTVTFLVREENFWDIVLPVEEAKLVARHIHEHPIDLRLGTELKEILADETGRVRAVKTDKNEKIPCRLVGLTVGVHPNIAVVQNTDIETDRGVLVNHYFETNLPDIYAAGDCVQFRKPLPGRRPIEQVWYTGKIHGATLAKTLTGEKTAYDPGVWFNAAKFLDIEYQTYGTVPPRLPDDQDSLFWEHPGGKKSVRINFRKSDGAVVGFNFFGIRARHTVCEKWIAEGQPINDVLLNLGALNFDPEFSEPFERDLIALYNRQHPAEPVSLQTKKGLFSTVLKQIARPEREVPS